MATKGNQTTMQTTFGIQSLDDILAGGLERDRAYLLKGNSGTTAR
jgi:circadian clock protein KaiC